MPQSPESPGTPPETLLFIDTPRYQKAYGMPAPIHEAVSHVVSRAERGGGARTDRGEMVAALIRHAVVNMSAEELGEIWLAYRRGSVEDLRSAQE